MFIKKITLHQFGRLNGEITLDPNKCNIICQDNEFGKTTLMDAVLYAFYNFPTQGFKRSELRPKDRYRPWGVPDNTGFTVEIDLQDNVGQNFHLKADFNRQQPFSLLNADTNQPIPLEGMSFGARKFRMPIQSFIQCFFFRQDEREGDRGELIRIIEEAAAANPRETPSSVSRAINLLSNPKIGIPEFSGDSQIQTSTLLNRISEKITQHRDKLNALEAEIKSHEVSVASSSEMDVQILDVERLQKELEYEVLRKEIEELESQVLRQTEINEAIAQREARVNELKEYEKFNPENRPVVQEKYTAWRVVQDKFAGVEKRLASGASGEVGKLTAELNRFPSTMEKFSSAELDKLMAVQTIVTDKRGQIEREKALLAELENRLEKEGVPLDQLQALREKQQAISSPDLKIITENTLARAEAETVAAEAEAAAAEAKNLSVQAKARKSWLNNIAFAASVAVIAFLVIGIVLLFTGKSFFGYVLVILAFLTGVGAFGYVARAKTKIDTEELKPALEQELSLSGQARKLREEAAQLHEELSAVLTRLNLTEDDVVEFRDSSAWLQAGNGWQNAVENLDKHEQECNAKFAEVAKLISQTRLEGDTDILDEESLPVAIDTLKEYLDIKKKCETASEEQGRLSTEKSELEKEKEEIVRQLDALLGDGRSDDSIEDRVNAYLDGCEKAVKLRALLDGAQNQTMLTPEKIEEYKDRIKLLTNRVIALEENNPEIINANFDESVSRLELQEKLRAVSAEKDDLTKRRANLFKNSDQAVEAWRTTGPELRDEIQRLTELRDQVQEFADAVAVAHSELSEIADEVYAQWATAINERVNDILPLINDKYKDVSLTRTMDISLYSEEAGRRLENREIQHLSKGARDQVGLAIRMAVSEFLSSHVGNLPLVLDEPFAHWDDKRFVEGMRFLEKITSRHQLIMLSCHQWRYEQLKAVDPALYSRINFVTLQPIKGKNS